MDVTFMEEYYRKNITKPRRRFIKILKNWKISYR